MTPAVTMLERAAVPFELLEYRLPSDSDARNRRLDVGLHAARALNLPEEAVFKTLIATLGNNDLSVAIIPVAAKLNMKALARAAGAKSAAMAETGRAERVTGYLTGGISPLGQKTRLPTYLAVEAVRLKTTERIYISAGRRGLELGLAAVDLISLTDAIVAELL